MGDIADGIIGDILEFGDEYLESLGPEDGTHTPGHRTYTCKHCGKDGLRWMKSDGRWRLYLDGKIHSCRGWSW